MPELPEIRAHAERLTDRFAGVVVAAVQPLSITALKTATIPAFQATGRPIDRVDQRGKYLIVRLGDTAHVVHLMQGGRLESDERQAKRPRGGVMRWVFADDRALLLTEPGTERRAGVWVLAEPAEGHEPLAGLGVEADRINGPVLADLAGRHSMRIHGFLRDQRIVAGLGRRLANEICHRAKLSPFATTGHLDAGAIERLAGAITSTIVEDLEAERSRATMSRVAERTSAVHGRTGETCPTCGERIEAVEYRSYTVNYCPACQTGGRMLADNTTSRFLK